MDLPANFLHFLTRYFTKKSGMCFLNNDMTDMIFQLHFEKILFHVIDGILKRAGICLFFPLPTEIIIVEPIKECYYYVVLYNAI